MQEPTSSLSVTETDALFALARRLRALRLSVVNISHWMAKILTLSDRVSVMRDTEAVMTADCVVLSVQAIVGAMLGEGNAALFVWHDRGPAPTTPSIPQVTVGWPSELRMAASTSVRVRLWDWRDGWARVGPRSEPIFGRRATLSGEILLEGAPVLGQADAIARGVAMVPEDLRKMGQALDRATRSGALSSRWSYCLGV